MFPLCDPNHNYTFISNYIYIEEVDSLFNGEFYKWLCHYVTLASNINLFGACTSLAEEGSASL